MAWSRGASWSWPTQPMPVVDSTSTVPAPPTPTRTGQVVPSAWTRTKAAAVTFVHVNCNSTDALPATVAVRAVATSAQPPHHNPVPPHGARVEHRLQHDPHRVRPRRHLRTRTGDGAHQRPTGAGGP